MWGTNLKCILLQVFPQAFWVLHVKADCFILRSTCCSRALIKTMPYLQRGPLKSVMSLQYFFSAFISFNIGSEIWYIQLLLSTEMEKYPIIWLLRLHFYAVPFMCLIFLLLLNLEALRYHFDPVLR